MMAALGDGGGTSGSTGGSSGAAGGAAASTGASTEGGAAATSGTGAASSGAASGGTSSAGATQGDKSLGTAGAAATSWRDSLPDELKVDPTLSKYSDLQNLAKAHIELQKKFGQKGVFKPGKDASAEELKSFRESMGIPTDPSKYDMGAFEGIEVPAATIQWAQKLGAEHGIEPTALKAVMTDYMKLEAQTQAAQAAQAKDAMKKGLDGLKTEWGDAYDRNLKRAEIAAEKLGGKPLIDELVALKAHNSPLLLKALAEAAKLYGEDTLREQGAGDGRQAPQELDAEIRAVQGRMLAMKPSDGAYLGLRQRYESLWRQKTGGR